MTKFINLTEKTVVRLKGTAPYINEKDNASQIADLSEVGTIEEYLNKYLIESLPPVDSLKLPEIKFTNTKVKWVTLEDSTVIHHRTDGYYIVENIPEPVEDVIYITTVNVAEAAKRYDVVCPISIKEPINKSIIGAFNFYSFA